MDLLKKTVSCWHMFGGYGGYGGGGYINTPVIVHLHRCLFTANQMRMRMRRGGRKKSWTKVHTTLFSQAAPRRGRVFSLMHTTKNFHLMKPFQDEWLV